MKPLAPQSRESESKSGRQTARGSLPQKTRPQEKGYILLTLLLVVALLGIFALTVTSKVDFEIKRDQEQEMIHRGVQYSRAIRGYYKKFGRYPTRLEDLDNTNNLRYLRKHYKDPLNKNKDFRLLHFGEQGVNLAGGLGGGGLGGSIPGASPAGAAAGLNGPGQNGSAFGGGTAGSVLSSGVNSSGVFAQSSGFGGNSKSGLGANSNSDAAAGQAGTTPASGSDPTQASAQVAPGTAQGNTTQGDTGSSSQQLVASGPIVGVASNSRNDTIREFNKKKRYNEWQFLYDPAFDRGGLITTPYQPLLQTLINPGQNNLQPGATGTSSPGQSSFGQTSFGQSGQAGYGTGSSPGGTAPPVPPAPTPPQQQ
jgi:type II secretory pathway pseudopilin PulG